MNYSPVGIANMALMRIGARGTIGSFDEDSPNANKVNAVWDMVFQEVLSERDWKFAKTRIQLQQNANRPVGGYRFAYALPSDFLRLCKPREIPEERPIADSLRWAWDDWGFGHHRDRPVSPREVHPYIVETVLNTGTNPSTGADPSYTTNLLTDYPGCGDYVNYHPIVINYIRLISDFTQLMPGFVNAFTDRLASELAIPVTEDKNKAETRMALYRMDLCSAQAQLECDDFLQDEAGSQSWISAGRYGRERY